MFFSILPIPILASFKLKKKNNHTCKLVVYARYDDRLGNLVYGKRIYNTAVLLGTSFFGDVAYSENGPPKTCETDMLRGAKPCVVSSRFLNENDRFFSALLWIFCFSSIPADDRAKFVLT